MEAFPKGCLIDPSTCVYIKGSIAYRMHLSTFAAAWNFPNNIRYRLQVHSLIRQHREDRGSHAFKGRRTPSECPSETYRTDGRQSLIYTEHVANPAVAKDPTSSSRSVGSVPGTPGGNRAAVCRRNEAWKSWKWPVSVPQCQ